MPIAIKDTLDVEGDVTMLGTSGFDAPAPKDSVLVTRLREAGAVLLGKTNLPELAIHGFTESQTFGATRNPWDTERTTGGSSGGSGAAVAAGLAALAHASDGAGSIRYPAANCGLFGLKPQRDRVPIDAEHWSGLDGQRLRQPHGRRHRPLPRRRHLRLVLVGQRAAGSGSAASPRRAASPPGRLRVAVSVKPPRAIAPPQLLDDSRRMVEETAELLARLGHSVEWRDPDWGMVGNQIAARYLGGIARGR